MRLKCDSHSIFKSFIFLLFLNTLACNHLFYRPDQLFYVDPAIANVEYNNLEWIHSEGLKLQILEMLPSKNVSEKGTILHFHGNAQNRSAHFQFTYWLTQYGYRVLVPDYQGYGGSEGTPTRKSLLNDGIFFIQKTCEEFSKPVFVFAQSLGAAIAIPSLAKKESCVRGLIVESSFSSYRRIARQKLDSVWLTWAFQYPLSFLVSDEDSPIDFIDQIRIPILFVHGTADKVVPYEFGKELYDKATSSSKELWTLPDAGHTAAFVEKQSPYKTRLIEWLSKH